MNRNSTVLVTGGAGYVGSVLVPQLLSRGYRVKVLDWYVFRPDVFDAYQSDPNLVQIKGDIRDEKLLRDVLIGVDVVIHLACVANDPSFELNPRLSKAINFDCFKPLVMLSKQSGVSRFIYASTSSVYGVSDEPEVTEEHPLVPLTDYNKYKGLCEPILLDQQSDDFTTVVIRPATVCGYGPRQRLDLTVNILTNHAFNNKKITVFGGSQMRPNIHINDVVDLYDLLLEMPATKIAGRTYNAGYENHTVSSLAEITRQVVLNEIPELGDIEITTTLSADNRSYHISSEKIHRELGFTPKRTIADAVRDLLDAFRHGLLPNSMTDPRYYNIQTMQQLQMD